MAAHPPSPSLVTRDAASPLPRWLLLAVCAAWILPGLLGRGPWRGVDVTSHAVMLAMAEGRSPWWTPQIGGMAVDVALLPHWLGAGAILVAGPWVGDVLAARLPFIGMLSLALLAVWQATRDFAHAPAARPLPLAFGGEPATPDYARALADGAVLALVATLGLVDVGHQLSPEIVQLAAVALLLKALSGLGWRPWLRIASGAALALALLGASGAPGTAVVLGAMASGLTMTARAPHRLPLAGALASATVAAAVLGGWLDAPRWGDWVTWVNPAGWTNGTNWAASKPWIGGSLDDVASLGRLFLWFLWPAWVPALWTLWRWRHQLRQPHVALPLASALIGLAACALSARSDRVLLLALPGTAILAAFALPTLRRGTAAAIDWFSMMAATATAGFIWVIYVAMHTGWPAKPASRVAILAPAFEPAFEVATLVIGLTATLAWLAAVRWRTGRHRTALWKSMVLPAGGITTCWLLLMTLWGPLVDHDRSPADWLARMHPAITEALGKTADSKGATREPPTAPNSAPDSAPTDASHSAPTTAHNADPNAKPNAGSEPDTSSRAACVAVVDLPLHLAAALESMAGYRVRILSGPTRPSQEATASCKALVTSPSASVDAAAHGWVERERVSRPTKRQDIVVIMGRP